jgi:hypothetical protein
MPFAPRKQPTAPEPQHEGNGDRLKYLGGEAVHNIDSNLIHLAVNLDTLVLDPNNAKHHGPKSIQGIQKSLTKYMQKKPVVVRKGTNVVLAGNGTVEAARGLGWTHIAATVVEMDDLAAAGYAIADNRTAELSDWNYERLQETMNTLRGAGEDLEDLGWTPDRLSTILAADWSPPQVVEETETPADEASHPLWLTQAQLAVVQQAMTLVRDTAGAKEDELPDGYCLEEICKTYLEMSGAG